MAEKKKLNVFIKKMKQYYMPFKENLEEIIGNREMYIEGDEYVLHREVLRIYDMSKEFEESDKELSEALYLTSLWYICAFEIAKMEYNFVEEGDKGRQIPNFNEIMKYLQRKYCIISFNKTPFVFINAMYYDGKNRLEKDIVKILEQQNFSDNRKIEPMVRDIMYRISRGTWKSYYPFNTDAGNYVPVRNGVIARRADNMLLPKSPAWGFTYSLPVDYKPDAPSDMVQKFFNEIVNPEDTEFLVQMPAQALTQNENYQMAYLLTGDGANGKSTYINLLRGLIGRETTTSISLQELVEDKFKAAELQGKLMNLYADLPKASVKTTGKIKILTGGDAVTVEKKFCDPFQFINQAVFVFSANELPSVDDSTYAFWRRWAVIEFPFKFEVDPTFPPRLMTEENLSGFLNLVLAKMTSIERDGLTRSKKVEKIMDMWKARSNSAYAFVRDTLVKSPMDFVEFGSLFSMYQAYCEDHDMTALTKNKLSMEIEKTGATSTLKTIDRQRKRVYMGVKIRGKDDPVAPPKPQADPENTVETSIGDFQG